MRQILIGAFMLLSAFTAIAQHSISGKVLDEKGSALVGATVVLQNSSNVQTTTNDGTFFFDQLKKNQYSIEVSFIGYETIINQLNVDQASVIKLKPTSYSMNEITVTSLLANERSALAYSNVSAKEIGKRNLGQDLPYLLALTPSFVTFSDAGAGVGYTGFRVRGTDANRINMTVNGVPLNDSESHGVFFVNMPDFASSLSSVQVQRGVGTSTNGAAAFGASINMQTETLIAKPYAELSSTLGSFNTNKNSMKVGTGLLDNKFAFDARISNITSDGYMDRASVDMKSYYLAAGYYADKTTVKFITFGGSEKTYQAWNGVSGDSLSTNRTYNELGSYMDVNGNTQFYNNQTDNYNQTHYQLHFLHELNPNLHLNATAHYTKGKGYYEEYKTERSYTDYGLTAPVVNGYTLDSTDLVRRKWLDNQFMGATYALTYDKNNINATIGGSTNRYIGHHFGNVIWVQNSKNLDVANEYYRSKSTKDETNVYAKANAEVLNNLFVMADVQYRVIQYSMVGTTGANIDITQEHPFIFFNPKFGATYKFGKNNDVYASYSIANREPMRNNYTDAGVNEKPISERLKDIEVGYRFQSPNFSFGANLYYMKYKDQLILTGKISEIGEMLTSNIADSYRSGIELTTAAKITNWLKWDGNVTLSKNKIKNFTEEGVDVYDADWNWTASQNNYLGTTDIAYSPNVIANSIFTFNYKALECGLHSNYVGKQYIDNTSDNVRSIDAYFVNNLNLKYSLKLNNLKSVDFNVLVNNLFGEVYESNGWTWYSAYVGGERINDLRFFPQAGRNFLASVTLKF